MEKPFKNHDLGIWYVALGMFVQMMILSCLAVTEEERAGSVLEGPRVYASPASLRCVLEQEH